MGGRFYFRTDELSSVPVHRVNATVDNSVRETLGAYVAGTSQW